jgi:DNA polymerase
MVPYGKGRKDVLVVGEAPGATEDEQGRPFIGKAGQFLRDVLDDIDVDLDRDAITTNAIICRPEGNRTPEPKEILYCRPNLRNTIEKFQPRVVVTLGRVALSSVLEGIWKDDVGPLERWVGWRIPYADYWICPTYHPSFLLRSKNKLMDRLFKLHLTMAFGIQADPPELPDLESQVEVMYSEKEVARRIERIVQRNVSEVVVDFETNCAKPALPNAQLHSCALLSEGKAISFPWLPLTKLAMGNLFRESRIGKIAHNLKFEEQWALKEFGHGIAGWKWDSMLAAHCLDNRTGICSLKFQSLVRLGVPSYNEHIAPYLEPQRGPYNRIGEINTDQLLRYGGMDVILEDRLAKLQRKDMRI